MILGFEAKVKPCLPRPEAVLGAERRKQVLPWPQRVQSWLKVTFVSPFVAARVQQG